MDQFNLDYIKNLLGFVIWIHFKDFSEILKDNKVLHVNKIHSSKYFETAFNVLKIGHFIAYFEILVLLNFWDILYSA